MLTSEGRRGQLVGLEKALLESVLLLDPSEMAFELAVCLRCWCLEKHLVGNNDAQPLIQHTLKQMPIQALQNTFVDIASVKQT